MRYDTLLTGSNKMVIDEFFLNMDDVFYCVTTSLRYDDIIRHIQVMKPELLIFCVNSESRDIISRMVSVKQECEKNNVVFVVIGEESDCRYFNSVAYNVADVTLIKPITNLTIKERLTAYMKNRQKEQNKINAAEQKKREEEAKVSDDAMKLVADILNEEPADNALPAEEAETDGKKHVLIVDDDPKMLKLIKRHLEDKYEVATAVSGKIALRFLEKKKTSLILLDYEMPGENGAQVLAKIRQMKMGNSIPVIFLTGVSDRERVTEILACNPQGYLLKPVDHKKLLDAVSGQLDK